MNYPPFDNRRTIGNLSFSDMLGDVSAIRDIDDSIATLTTAVLLTNTSSSSETNRAIASENQLTAFVTAEAIRAGSSETLIKASVTTETARAKAAEAVLSTAVTALQAAPTTNAQDYTMTGWWFGAFGSQYVEDGSSLSVNIRVYLVGSIVYLKIFAGFNTVSSAATQINYHEFLPTWARPSVTVTVATLMYNHQCETPALLYILDTGLLKITLYGNPFNTYGGFPNDTCVSYMLS